MSRMWFMLWVFHYLLFYYCLTMLLTKNLIEREGGREAGKGREIWLVQVSQMNVILVIEFFTIVVFFHGSVVVSCWIVNYMHHRCLF